MPSESRFCGAVCLPSSVLIEEAALGERFRIDLGGLGLVVSIPALPSSDPEDGYSLVCPVSDMHEIDESVRHESERAWGSCGFGIRPGHPRILASYVDAVAIEATMTVQVSEPANDASVVGEAFDAWWANVVSWLEVWTPQHLDPDNNLPPASRGHLFCVDGTPIFRTGWSPPQHSRIWSSDDAVTRSMLASAFRRAGTGEMPSLSWRLLSRAYRLHDTRQALMNGAAAAEVALAEVVSSRLGPISEPARERIVKNANGIVGLLQLVEQLDAVAETSTRQARIKARVAGPRNDAAHRGMTPTDVTLSHALREVRELLNVYTPVPAPG